MAPSPVIESQEAAIPPKGKSPLILTIAMAMGAALLASCTTAAGAYYLLRSGRLHMPETGPTPAKAAETLPMPTHSLLLEPLVANLADTDVAAYLRVGLMLRVVDEPGAKAKPKAEKTSKGPDDADTMLRDTVLSVVGQQTSESLMGPLGKDHLKRDLRQAFLERNQNFKVADLYFTEFLVQR